MLDSLPPDVLAHVVASGRLIRWPVLACVSRGLRARCANAERHADVWRRLSLAVFPRVSRVFGRRETWGAWRRQFHVLFVWITGMHNVRYALAEPDRAMRCWDAATLERRTLAIAPRRFGVSESVFAVSAPYQSVWILLVRPPLQDDVEYQADVGARWTRDGPTQSLTTRMAFSAVSPRAAAQIYQAYERTNRHATFPVFCLHEQRVAGNRVQSS